jgi:hypothetical protein
LAKHFTTKPLLQQQHFQICRQISYFIAMSKPLSDPASAAAFFSNFSRLHQPLRRAAFRFLGDDLGGAAGFAISCLQYAQGMICLLFRSYRGINADDMFISLAALTEVLDFSSHVETLVLSAPFDGLGQSGLYEWLLVFDGMNLAPGHLGLRVQHHEQFIMQTAQQSGLQIVNGKLVGSEAWPHNWHHGMLLGHVLPPLCPNVLRVELPASWEDCAAQIASLGFSRAAFVRTA